MSPSIPTYDLVIIGSGQAGNPLAGEAAGAGWTVAVIESDHPGGTCINTGCTPTKTLVASAALAAHARRGTDWGINVDGLAVDWVAVRARRNKMVDDFRGGTTKRLETTDGIDLIRGRAQFIGERELSIVKTSGDTAVVKAKRVVINTGGIAARPALEGLEEVPWVDSAGIQNVERLPDRLVVIGGGYIGLEFGQMFHRFGSHVTVVHRGDHLLSREDEDIAREVEKILEADGIRILNRARPVAARKRDDGLTLSVDIAGKQETFDADLLLVAAGRFPATDGLGLDTAGIATDPRGYIVTDENLATSAEGIWAVGDVKGGPAFTHISYDDFRILRDSWFRDHHRSVIGRPVPYTVFIDPQLGRVGLSEREARELEISFEVYSIPMTWVARALEAGETAGLIKALASPEDGRILGAAVLGMEGGEIATMFQLAMAGGLTVADLRETIFPHPGLAEALNNLFAYGKR